MYTHNDISSLTILLLKEEIRHEYGLKYEKALNMEKGTRKSFRMQPKRINIQDSAMLEPYDHLHAANREQLRASIVKKNSLAAVDLEGERERERGASLGLGSDHSSHPVHLTCTKLINKCIAYK